jgi:hypothetical protein
MFSGLGKKEKQKKLCQKKKQNKHYFLIFVFFTIVKEQCHEIFEPRFFLLNCTPGFPDSWLNGFLHINLNLRELFDNVN